MEDQGTQVYQHSTREDWGLAILAWEQGSRRAYQFEDGELRLFKKGYYDFLEPVSLPVEKKARVVARLSRRQHLEQARREVVKEARATGDDIITLEDMIGIFKLEFPEGFDDDGWLNDVRGIEVNRRLKRHRDPAIDEAQEELSKEALKPLIKGGKWKEVVDLMVKHLDATDLVPRSHFAGLDKLDAEHQEGLARALFDLLHEGDISALDRLVRAMEPAMDGKGPSWQAVTTIAALVHPERYVAVHPTTFREAARWMAPRLDYDRSPSAALYEQFVLMAERLRMGLEENGMKPRDYLDVRDFVWRTLRPTGKKRLEEARENMLSEDAA